MHTTRQNKRFWEQRKINWAKDYLEGVIDHPHRQMIIDTLSQLRFRSVLEVGMGAGANLLRIKHQWPAVEVGGSDINRDAVVTASHYLGELVKQLRAKVPEEQQATIGEAKYLDQGDPRDIFLSDNSVDIVMSDACLIYLGPWAVRKALKEMKRVARNYLVLCELHSEKRVRGRYNIHNYVTLLEDLDCFDIKLQKIPKEVWPGTPWEQYGHIITATFI